MIATAAVWFASLWGRVALGAGLVAALVAVRACDVSKQRSIGAEGAVKKIERATDNAVKKAESARERVYRDPAAAERLRAKYGLNQP